MYFTDRMKPLYRKTMSNFIQLPEFEKELKRLSKKYPSLDNDIEDIKPILLSQLCGIGKNFTIIYSFDKTKIVKARIHCESLRKRTIRLIYSYRENEIKFIFIELYFKGEKENEDRERIIKYLKNYE